MSPDHYAGWPEADIRADRELREAHALLAEPVATSRPAPNAYATMQGFMPRMAGRHQGLSTDPTRASRSIHSDNLNLEGGR